MHPLVTQEVLELVVRWLVLPGLIAVMAGVGFSAWKASSRGGRLR